MQMRGTLQKHFKYVRRNLINPKFFKAAPQSKDIINH